MIEIWFIFHGYHRAGYSTAGISSRTSSPSTASATSLQGITNMKVTGVRLRLERETKGALRYHEVDSVGRPINPYHPQAVIGTLYIRKNGMRGEMPEEIVITIESVE